MRTLLLLLFLGPFFPLFSQNYYYPPLTGAQWETLSPDSLHWCEEKISALYDFLEEKNTKSFIVLKEGKIVLEQYFGTYTADSLWYFASASKSVMGLLTGMAQEEGFLDINEPVSNYLGEGWTSCTPTQEAAITIKHQLSMNSGLDDGLAPSPTIPNPSNCLDPACLQYLTDSGERWAYHNAPYRLTQDVLEAATGMSKNAYTNTHLDQKIGTNLIWFNYVLYGKAREMARFGHLMLSDAVWDGDTLLQDQNYLTQMLSSSQSLNPAYGYLWWLNGQSSYLLPGLQFIFDGPMIPEAPTDLVAALGKNDQKIYVVPSLDLVVIRQGNSAGGVPFALSSFDNQLWSRLGDLECTVSVEEDPLSPSPFMLSPNPARDVLQIDWQGKVAINTIELYHVSGQHLSTYDGSTTTISLAALKAGIYLIQIRGKEGVWVEKFVKE